MHTQWMLTLSFFCLLVSAEAIGKHAAQAKTTYCRGPHSERNCMVNSAGCKKTEQCVVQYYYLDDCEVTTCIKK